MDEQKTKSRSPKSQGITKGRSKKNIIKKRYKICRTLVRDNSSNLKTREEFLKKYRENLEAEGIVPVPSNQTLIKDLKKCNINFKFGVAQISKENEIFTSLGDNINYYLRQIRLVYGTNDITLLDTYVDPMIYPRTFDALLSSLAELTDDTLEKDSTSSNTNSATTNKPKKIVKHHLMYLHFILDKRGFEDLIKDAFCQDCIAKLPYFLFIQTHCFCTTIVLEYKELKTVIEKTYHIIKNYPYDQ